MSKSRRVSRKPIYTILVLSLILALGFATYRSLYTPTPIFLITQNTLEYGDTTVVGTLRKDSPVGKPGTYLLVLSDSRAITLDVKGLDNLLGFSVSVTGYLLPANGDTPMSMTVSSISTSTQ